MGDKELMLLRRFAEDGDAEAFSQIVQRHSGMVYSVSLRVLGDGNRAADVTQETFLELIKKADQITTTLSSWLHKVATHKSIDVIRRESRRRRREAGYSAEKPLETTKWEDLSVHIDEELENLDRESREILIRRFFEGKSTTEIAEANEISQSTASRRIETGVSELRAALRKKGLLVGAGALWSLLAQNTVQAAPAAVVKELGKLALAGGQAAGASAAGSATAASGSAAEASAGVMAGVKAKVIAATAAAAVGVGGAITVKELSEAPEPAPVKKQVQQSVNEPEIKERAESSVEKSSGPYTHIVTREEAEVGDEEPVADAAAAEKPAERESEGQEPAPSGMAGGRRRVGGYGGGWYVGGYGARYAGSPEEEDGGEREGPNEPEEREGGGRRRRRRSPGGG